MAMILRKSFIDGPYMFTIDVSRFIAFIPFCCIPVAHEMKRSMIFFVLKSPLQITFNLGFDVFHFHWHPTHFHFIELFWFKAWPSNQWRFSYL